MAGENDIVITNDKPLVPKGKTDSISVKTPDNTPNAFIARLEEAEKIAEYVAKSTTFGKPFEIPIKDDEGNLIRMEISTGDVVSCILLGQEIGLQPMAAIVLGKRLNSKSYFSVLKGKELGLDAMTSIQQISSISTQNGEVYHIGTHIINKVLLDNNVKVTILADFEPIYKYKEMIPVAGTIYDTFNETSMLLYINGITTAKDITDAKAASKKVVTKEITDRYTEIRFVRPSKDIDYTLRLTLQECTDCGWYNGWSSTSKSADGKPMWVEGKFNWNTMTRLMLRNRVISQGGRFVCDDRLNGLLSVEEAYDINNIKASKEEIATIEIKGEVVKE